MNLKMFLCALVVGGYSQTAVLAQDSLSVGGFPWTLQQCVDYALVNNLQLKQNLISKRQSDIDVVQQRAALFPSLSFSTNHNTSWRPWSESTVNLSSGTMTSTSSTVNYNGSYGLNASWTVWNGGRNIKNLEKSKLSAEMSDLEADQTANSIQEQITQYYVQILYQTEAISVNEAVLSASKLQRDRAKQMVEVGSLAHADLAQLEAQVSQDEYSVVNAQTQLENFKLQLKQILELIGYDDFSVSTPNISDEKVLVVLPTKEAVFQEALRVRPEIRRNQLSLESADLDIDIARRGYYPSVSLSAGIGSSHSSGLDTAFTKQLRRNLSNSVGVTVSVPIFDNRQNKSNLEKSRLAKESSQIALQNAEKELYSQIESYWLNARNAQHQYIAAKANVESMQESYDLLSEQFRLGLKNIVELTTGKNNL